MAAKAPIERGKILIIDDEKDMLFLLQKLLEPHYDVFTAQDVEQAENIIAHQDQLRVILCDHEMPGCKGLEFLGRLKDRRNPATRILITGFSTEELVTEALNSRTLFAFLGKPFTALRLTQLVQDAEQDWKNRQGEHVESNGIPQTEQAIWRQKLSRAAQSIFGLGSLALLTLLGVSVIGGGVGLLILLLLYVIKSALGIDFFADRHLSDFF